METQMHFEFKNELFNCAFYIDSSEIPCYVFIELQDLQLIEIFGEEITIKTDFEKVLPKQDDYRELVELRQALFDALQKAPDFLTVRRRLKNFKE